MCICHCDLDLHCLTMRHQNLFSNNKSRTFCCDLGFKGLINVSSVYIWSCFSWNVCVAQTTLYQIVNRTRFPFLSRSKSHLDMNI